MKSEKNSFFKCVKILFTRLLSGHVHFSKKLVGKVLSMGDGKKFQVIRYLKVDAKTQSSKSTAVFILQFKFSGLPLAVNKILSMFPAPFLIAKTDFLEKIWTVSEESYFQGIYQWSSEESAKKYPESFIFKIMSKRSAAGTLSYKIIPIHFYLIMLRN